LPVVSSLMALRRLEMVIHEEIVKFTLNVNPPSLCLRYNIVI